MTWLRISEFRSATFALKRRDDDGGNNRDGAGDQSAQPWAQANVKKAFHHDLAGERAGERGVLTGSEKRQGKYRARSGYAEERRQQFVGILDFGDVAVAVPVESGGGDDQDRGVDE